MEKEELQTMKSLVWTGPRQMEMQEGPRPVPKKGEVLLRVSLAGICGSELSGYLGENSLRKPPLVMGHEFSGSIIECGEGVNDWQEGQLVTVNPLVTCGECRYCKNGLQPLCPARWIVGIHRPGAFAEYVIVPQNACYAIQDEIQGALVEPLACAVRANMQARIELNDTVLVTGAGIIGLMALRVAKELGASRLLCVDTNEARLEKSRIWGATHTLNPRQQSVVDFVQQTFPAGVDRVIDAVGLPQTRRDGIAAVRPGGRVVFIGLHENDTTIPGNEIVRSEIEIVGSFCYADQDFHRALALLTSGKVVADTSWLDVRPLAAGKSSFDEQIDGPALFPKILLRVN